MDPMEVEAIYTPPDSDMADSRGPFDEPATAIPMTRAAPAPQATGEDPQTLPRLTTLVNPDEGVTELMVAARRGDEEVVMALIDEQACQVDARGRTALMYAAEMGRSSIVELLKDREAGIQDSFMWTALFYAAQNGHLVCVSMLAPLEAKIQRKDGCTALFLAVFWNHIECARVLAPLEAGITTNYKHWQGGEYTALMEAARWARIECIELLVEQEHGMKDASGNRAIDYARAPYAHVPADRREQSIKLLEKYESE